MLKKYYADKTCMNLLRVFIFAIAISLIYLTKYYLYMFPRLMWGIIVILSVALVGAGLIWLPLYFSKAYYLVSSQEVIRNTGFFIRVRQIMKVSAVQYTTIILTPFSSVTGFNFVILNALGGNLFLLFLSKTDAEEIARTLTESISTRRK